MATFEVGMGTPITGIFSSIDWSNSPYFLKIENDPKGGTNYSMTGISEILSVPYAMHAKTAETLSGNISDLFPTIWNMNGNRIYYNNGNVGIGINKPTRTLHINKGYDAFPILVHSPTGSTGIEINTPVNGASGGILYSFGSTPTWYNYAFRDFFSFREEQGLKDILVLKTNGNVGIGTTNPITTLDVNGAVNVNNNNITNLATPVNENDAVNKAYVDYEQLCLQSQLEQFQSQQEQFQSRQDQFQSQQDQFQSQQEQFQSHQDHFQLRQDQFQSQQEQFQSRQDQFQSEINKLQNTISAGGFVADVDGNRYNTVKIGAQTWMAENLKTTKYNDGSSIPLITDDIEWSNLTSPAFCWFSNDEINKDKYGALYNGYTIATGNLCPTGWHVSSDAEWSILKDFLTNNGYSYEGNGDDIGKSIAATNGWESSDTPGDVGNDQASNNSTGFSALPGGYRENGFCAIVLCGHWWTSTESDVSSLWFRHISYNSNTLSKDKWGKYDGFSVRCVKD